MIAGLKDANGDWQTCEDNITIIIKYYFGELFTTSFLSGQDDVLGCIQSKVTIEANVVLCKPYTRDEVDGALAQSHPHNAQVRMERIPTSSKRSRTLLETMFLLFFSSFFMASLPHPIIHL